MSNAATTTTTETLTSYRVTMYDKWEARPLTLEPVEAEDEIDAVRAYIASGYIDGWLNVLKIERSFDGGHTWCGMTDAL